MNEGKYVFAQLMSFLPKYEFQKCVEKYSGDYKPNGLLVVSTFGQCVLHNSPLGKA